jgi:hypothetical protein
MHCARARRARASTLGMLALRVGGARCFVRAPPSDFQGKKRRGGGGGGGMDWAVRRVRSGQFVLVDEGAVHMPGTL